MARDRDLANIDARVRQMERSLNEGVGKHDQQINELMAGHGQLRDMYGSVEGRKHANDAHHAALEQRLKGLETHLGNTLADHSQELQNAKKQVQVLQGRLTEAEQSNRNLNRISAPPIIGKSPAKRFKDLDQIHEHGMPPKLG